MSVSRTNFMVRHAVSCILLYMCLAITITAQAGVAYIYWEASANNAETRLQKAAAAGRVREIVKLVAGGDNINDGGSSRETPLMFAARANRLEAVITLLRLGADPNIKTGYGRNTALVFAAAYAGPKVVQALLVEGADPNIQPDSSPMGNGDALAMARQNGKEDNARLIEKALDGPVVDGQHCLMHGIDRMVYEDPKLLLNEYFNPNIELKQCNRQELRIIRNSIFARKNYRFRDMFLLMYFRMRFDAYDPLEEDVSKISLTTVDKSNIKFIQQLESRLVRQDF